MTRTVLATTLLLAAAISAAQTQVPHTFESGQRARASEVNANFSALEDGIQQLESISHEKILDLTDTVVEITNPGFYVLDQDWDAPGLQLIISANRVMLDLRGYSIGNGSQTVLIEGNDVTVKNGSIKGDSALTTLGYGSVLENLIVVGTREGVVLGGTEEFNRDYVPIGGGSTLRNSYVTASAGVAVRIFTPSVTVQGNKLSSRDAVIQMDGMDSFDERRWLARYLDNQIFCDSVIEDNCIYISNRGNLMSRNTLIGFFETNTAPVIKINGSENQVIDTTFTVGIANSERPYDGAAIEISGRNNVVRGTAMQTVIFATGILFSGSQNAYGHNQVTAFGTAFGLTGTEVDLGGNWSN